VDRVTQSAQGPDAPEEMPPANILLTLLLSFKSGEARGRHTVMLRPEDPAGHQLEPMELPLHLEGEDRGANLVIQMGFVAEHEGLYWIDVFLDSDRCTRIPLRVVYEPMRAGG
jgi:hypothetical protein